MPTGAGGSIAELWSEDGSHILQPTQEMYEAADERAVNPTWRCAATTSSKRG